MKVKYDWPGRKLLLARGWKSRCLIVYTPHEMPLLLKSSAHMRMIVLPFTFTMDIVRIPDLHRVMTGGLNMNACTPLVMEEYINLLL